MELKEIITLLDRFGAAPISRLELELGDMRLRLEKESCAEGVVSGKPAEPVTAASPAARTEEVEGTLIKSPLVGTFYASPGPGKPSFVSPGDRVEKGQVLCILEAMKMMSEVPSPVSGAVLEVLAEDGDLVGFDTPLFRIGER